VRSLLGQMISLIVITELIMTTLFASAQPSDNDIQSQADELAKTLSPDAGLEIPPDLLVPVDENGSYIVVVFMMILLGATVFCWIGFRKSARKTPLIGREELPDEAALRRLNRLKQRQLQYDPFYVALARIVKSYLKDRWDLDLFEKTTDELKSIITPKEVMDEKDLLALVEMMESCDRVKFSGCAPREGKLVEDLSLAVDFVKRTAAFSKQEEVAL